MQQKTYEHMPIFIPTITHHIKPHSNAWDRSSSWLQHSAVV